MKLLCTNVVGLLLSLLGTTTETEDQVKRGLLLDVVIAESTAVLELLAGEDQALLVGRNAGYLISNKQWRGIVNNSPFLVLNFGLDIVDCVRGLDFKSDGFARKARMIHRNINTIQVKAKEDSRLDENLHVDSDAPVCPTNSTMESLTKARAGVEERNRATKFD
jgi:hypothetical protein